MSIVQTATVTVQKAYRYSFYPTAEQKAQLAKEFGHARWVWNHCLEVRKTAYEERKENLNTVALSRLVTQWKQDKATEWLKEATASCLTQTLMNQDKAFQAFFRRVKAGQKPGYPKFKSRHNKQAVRYQIDQRILKSSYCAGEYLKLPKIGYVNLRWSQIPAGIPKMATVSKTPSGHYFVSFSCEVMLPTLPVTGQSIGIDLGIKDVAVGSDGYKSGNPKPLNGLQRHLKRQQRHLARKQKGSKRRERQRIKVAKIYERITCLRKEFLQTTTTEIVRNADVIALENLNVQGMMKNHHLARAIADVGMYEFRRQIEYKAHWYGRKVIFVDRWFPSSKTCSACGHVLEKLPLKVREWECPHCGIVHDRDVNAARNILQRALENDTAGRAGIHARGVSKNLSTQRVGTHDETRTDAKKSDEAARQERAASSLGADSNHRWLSQRQEGTHAPTI